MVTFIVAGFLVLLCLSIATVFWVRVRTYYGYGTDVHPDRPFPAQVLELMEEQLPHLLVHRWIGLEGVLAVGADPGRGSELFVAAIKDHPPLGERSLYSRTAKEIRDPASAGKLTFGSNAGIVAILFFSGSLLIVGIGMAAMTLLLLVTEYLARRWTGNPFFLAVAGAALANVLVQTTIPYLTMIFLLQLWSAIAFVGLLQYRGRQPLAQG
jgi:hypothetical protein